MPKAPGTLLASPPVPAAVNSRFPNETGVLPCLECFGPNLERGFPFWGCSGDSSCTSPTLYSLPLRVHMDEDRYACLVHACMVGLVCLGTMLLGTSPSAEDEGTN